MKKGDQIFFEGLVYKVVETPTDPADQDKRVSRLGHFRAEGSRDGKHPTVESHPKHLQELDPKTAQEEIDAEQGQWIATYTPEPDEKLRKALMGTVVGHAREASATAARIKGTCYYLPGRLIQPPVPRPAIATMPPPKRGRRD
jgi:hypothetical protein